MYPEPYAHATIIGKRFRRKSNHRTLSTVKQRTDAVARPKHVEIVQIQYDSSYHGDGILWWELTTFENDWEEINPDG